MKDVAMMFAVISLAVVTVGWAWEELTRKDWWEQ